MQGGNKEAPGAVIAHVVYPGLTKEQYDKVRAAVDWLNRVPEGGISHVTWWENEAAFNAFGLQRVGPAMAQLGIQASPQVTFHPAHEVFLPKAVTITAS